MFSKEYKGYSLHDWFLNAFEPIWEKLFTKFSSTMVDDYMFYIYKHKLYKYSEAQISQKLSIFLSLVIAFFQAIVQLPNFRYP